ncbi:CRISPR-associated exonuclease, Cas4 family [Thermaerobacter subterraneus DSM 13965]|uniref:CRISPR-associated exonuclease Cas4 n=1 Tax=Thermaerobacter subterraneus DSM 13965 TaxID=867903 RepID=K6PRI3_9FIRM|nr:CRISPR-associated exonuclease, Cas4 family [Thermaerobacter subterraneus DSM 13965]
MHSGTVSDDEPVPISALQHYVYCPRQCALIHVERAWGENVFTLRGRRVHERADTPGTMVREGVRVERALPIWSERLGLIGQADVVEFLPDGTPFPVEYKSGPRLARRADEVQLCAQAICLEAMFGRPVPRGALYYHGGRRRREIAFTPSLREEVERVTQEVRRLLQQQQLPAPVADRRCCHCSLLDTCLPFAIRRCIAGDSGSEST